MAISSEAVSQGDTIEMISYMANELRYRVSLSVAKWTVFSEIYYPKGWQAYIKRDDKLDPIDIYRADWCLRSAYLPKGDYEVVMKFAPQSYTIGYYISLISSLILLIMAMLSLLFLFLKKTK